jgi:hypothetical protein
VARYERPLTTVKLEGRAVPRISATALGDVLDTAIPHFERNFARLRLIESVLKQAQEAVVIYDVFPHDAQSRIVFVNHCVPSIAPGGGPNRKAIGVR